MRFFYQHGLEFWQISHTLKRILICKNLGHKWEMSYYMADTDFNIPSMATGKEDVCKRCGTWKLD